MPTAFKFATIATALLALFLSANWFFQWRFLIVQGDANIMAFILGCAAIWVIAVGWRSMKKDRQ
jgi:hypothetical protein